MLWTHQAWPLERDTFAEVERAGFIFEVWTSKRNIGEPRAGSVVWVWIVLSPITAPCLPLSPSSCVPLWLLMFRPFKQGMGVIKEEILEERRAHNKQAERYNKRLRELQGGDAIEKEIAAGQSF
jgi:hypothetical protein